MAPKSIQMAITGALEDLVDANLEKFNLQLLSRKGKRVRESWVMGKSRVQITSVLVQTYTEKRALEVVVETLRDAGFKRTAQKLEKDAQKLTKPKSKSKAGGASGAAAGGRVRASDAVDDMDAPEDPAVSFILAQKMEFITCLGANLLILQLSQQNRLITRSEYNKLKSKPSMEDTVTDLIDVVMGKGPDHCRRFLQILKEPATVETYPLLENMMKDWK